MSHQPERAEKNCLNCGATVAGRFCQQCGQENVRSHMPFFALVRHFIYDIFHFDGKFFETLKYLFFRPGYVAREYVEGKRVKYLDPIRMYLFTSALFFLLFFTFTVPKSIVQGNGNNRFLSRTERLDIAMDLASRGALNNNDTLLKSQLMVLLDSTKRVELIRLAETDYKGQILSYKGANYLLHNEPDTSDFLPISSGEGWLGQKISHKTETLRDRYRDDLSAGLADLFDSFIHRMPYLLFLSLPFFAAILKLLYRRNKNFYYFDHAVFTLYHYIFSFILLLLVFGANSLKIKLDWGLFGMATTLMVCSWPIHLLFALKSFYMQGWKDTLAKFVLLNFMGLLVLLLLFLVFISFSFLML